MGLQQTLNMTCAKIWKETQTRNGERNWVLGCCLASCDIHNLIPFLYKYKINFSQSSQTLELLSLSSKPNSFNCMKIIQMCYTWNFFSPLSNFTLFFLVICIEYSSSFTRHKWRKKRGWGVFWKWNAYSCGYFNFLEIFSLFSG